MQCDTNSTNSTSTVKYGLQIDNEDYDGLDIDAVIIKINKTDILNIEYFCFNHSRTAPGTVDNIIAVSHCLDAEYNGYDTLTIKHDISGYPSYQSQLIVINPMLKNNESYVEIVDYNDSNFCYQCQPGICLYCFVL